jgi:hypothetical protein
MHLFSSNDFQTQMNVAEIAKKPSLIQKLSLPESQKTPIHLNISGCFWGQSELLSSFSKAKNAKKIFQNDKYKISEIQKNKLFCTTLKLSTYKTSLVPAFLVLKT